MKKLKTLLMMALVAMTALTSCDDDEIARTLEGTWEGYVEVSNYWNGGYYDAYDTKIHFNRNPYTYSSGTGYWVDYYQNHPWGGYDYVANHIEWTVDFGTIHIYFVEDDYSIEIWNYNLNDGYFEGEIRDGSDRVNFRLRKVASPNWNTGWHWGTSGGYYYSNEATFEGENGQTAPAKVAPEAPVRHFGKH